MSVEKKTTTKTTKSTTGVKESKPTKTTSRAKAIKSTEKAIKLPTGAKESKPTKTKVSAVKETASKTKAIKLPEKAIKLPTEVEESKPTKTKVSTVKETASKTKAIKSTGKTEATFEKLKPTLKIKSQKDFDSWVASIGKVTQEVVELYTNTYVCDKPIILEDLKALYGNSSIIEFTKSSQSLIGSGNPKQQVCDITIVNKGELSCSGFSKWGIVKNCKTEMEASLSCSGFKFCNLVIDSTTNQIVTDPSLNSNIGFSYCTRVENSNATVEGGNEPIGFHICDDVIKSTLAVINGLESIGFNECERVIKCLGNVHGESAVAYADCTSVVYCEGTSVATEGKGLGFNSCKTVVGSKGVGVGSKDGLGLAFANCRLLIDCNQLPTPKKFIGILPKKPFANLSDETTFLISKD